MISRDDICRICDAYIAAMSGDDVEAVMSLFAPDATQEEPIGTPPRVGHEEIRAFFTRSLRVPFTMKRMGPVTVVGRHAAFQARVDVRAVDSANARSLTATDVLSIDEHGKIAKIMVLPDVEADPAGGF
ncbi:hypothetical protein BJF79_34105 [Actinomadura sp. CNU-125]|uniref:nuclear transport factor 2 family protein n=1 Tax=Actinomadura sp. CNU-125 TaxID=1904961 RepID=UPI0009683EDF|nr:nuclear transport factor 2 family protein [Actinomadura sp. CNU-125]OLT33922.1 hypothetical protein BJF79_34105 [Actinomadura sp. CNU-125]